jgi:threonine synthase
MVESNTFVCTTCGTSYPIDTHDWRCACGGFFEFGMRPPLDAAVIDGTQSGHWRYRALLPLNPEWVPVSLGEGNTPLVEVNWEGHSVQLKLESLSPTGSFKDRGAAVLITALHGLGIQRVVEDSSGNAGASLAGYAARVGIACEVCVPASAAGPKLAQMKAFGAEVIEIKGRREYAALAAWAAAAHGAYYASHVYSPFFLVGIETLAYELWEQLGHRAPDGIVLPVGNGTLLLGVHRGFQRLHEAGLIPRLPRLFAVQAAACAPIYQAFQNGREAIEPVSTAPTVASGIAIGQPVRAAQILAAVRATDGAVFSVTEEKILQVRNQLARCGFYAEETSAVPMAALRELGSILSSEELIVVPVTGHGLKTNRPQ